jgi:hypothetical protein
MSPPGGFGMVRERPPRCMNSCLPPARGRRIPGGADRQ